MIATLSSMYAQDSALHPTSSPLDADMTDSRDPDSDADSDSRMSLDPFSSDSVSSATSLESDRRSMSSGNSVYSMTSANRAQSYRHEYGRGLNNYSEVYQLPADDEELERLDKQHIIFTETMGKYPPPMHDALADPGPGGEVVTCLDLGCGSGRWILDVARDFPHSSCVAVDLVPMQVTTMPPNCRSEVDDINLGLQHFYGDFNVVHGRLICSGVKDYEGLIDQCSQVLRPGGLLNVIEFDFRIYGADRQPVIANERVLEPPWLPRWLTLCREAVHHRGGDVDAANHLNQWVSAHEAFEDVVYQDILYPTSPFYKPDESNAQSLNRVGSSMREDIKAFLRSARPLLLSHGLELPFVDGLEREAHAVLNEAKIPYFIRVEAVHARKRR